MSGFRNIKAEMTRLRKELDALEKQGVDELKTAAITVVTNLMRLTPVWEGTGVRNYTVGVGGLAGGSEKKAIDNGPPGPTNSMSIGSEPRRSVNENAALAEAQSAVKALKKLKNIHIGNSAEHWDLIENGNAPTASTARNDGGVSLLALQRSSAALKNFKRP